MFQNISPSFTARFTIGLRHSRRSSLRARATRCHSFHLLTFTAVEPSHQFSYARIELRRTDDYSRCRHYRGQPIFAGSQEFPGVVLHIVNGLRRNAFIGRIRHVLSLLLFTSHAGQL